MANEIAARFDPGLDEFVDEAQLEELEALASEPEGRLAFLDKPYTRRDFLRVYGRPAVIATGLAYSGLSYSVVHQTLEETQKIEKKIWPENKPALTFLNGEKYNGQKHVGIFWPGYGDVHPEEEAEQWKKLGDMPEDMLIGYLDYSNEGATLEQIEQTIRDEIDINNLEWISAFGNSMGGLYATYLLPKLGVPLRSLEMCSSPSSFQDAVRLSGLAKFASHFPRNRTVATLGKAIGNAYQDYNQYGYSVLDSIRDGADELVHGQSPSALGQEFDIINQSANESIMQTFQLGAPLAEQTELKESMRINIFDPKLIRGLRRVCVPGFTHVSYAATLWPESDGTVIVVKSGNDFKKLYNDKLGVQFNLFGVKYRGHANVSATAHATRGWNQAIYKPY